MLSKFEIYFYFKNCRIFYNPKWPPELPLTDEYDRNTINSNNYECQVLDSFALDYNNPENNAIKTESINSQWCGSFYKFKLADLNMCYPPLQWQTYDITFTAPEFKDGKKVKNARITVLHNGVKIQDDVEMPKGTGNGALRPEKEKDYIYFQYHANPVAFRNLWLKEKN